MPEAKKNFPDHALYSLVSKQSTCTIANAESKRGAFARAIGVQGDWLLADKTVMGKFSEPYQV